MTTQVSVCMNKKYVPKDSGRNSVIADKKSKISADSGIFVGHFPRQYFFFYIPTWKLNILSTFSKHLTGGGIKLNDNWGEREQIFFLDLDLKRNILCSAPCVTSWKGWVSSKISDASAKECVQWLMKRIHISPINKIDATAKREFKFFYIPIWPEDSKQYRDHDRYN